MYKEIVLKRANGEERTYKFLACASTAYRYGQIFHEDLMTKLSNMEKEVDYTLADKLAYIMNAQAEGKAMKTLNYDSFIEWLDQLDSGELLANTEELITLYLGTKLTTSIPKKE